MENQTRAWRESDRQSFYFKKWEELWYQFKQVSQWLLWLGEAVWRRGERRALQGRRNRGVWGYISASATFLIAVTKYPEKWFEEGRDYSGLLSLFCLVQDLRPWAGTTHRFRSSHLNSLALEVPSQAHSKVCFLGDRRAWKFGSQHEPWQHASPIFIG